MKFSEDADSKHLMISAYGDDFITVNEQRHALPAMLDGGQPPRPWPVASATTLTSADLDLLLASDPEIVIIGCGPQQHFLPPELMHHIMRHGIGCEVMNTPSACRTWNIIVSEGRRVVAGLLGPTSV